MDKYLLNNILRAGLMVFCFHISFLAQTQSIQADPTFDVDGIVALDYLPDFVPNKQIIQSDGKILIAGYGLNDLNFFDGMLYRLNVDGSLDVGFGVSGFVRVDIDGTHDNIVGIAELSDHKIIVVVESNHRTILLRLLPNGDFDPDFGNDGMILGVSTSDEISSSMVLQADQKVLVTSSQLISGKHRGVVRRYNTDGSLDTSFGTNGKVILVIDPSKNFELNTCVLQPDGKLLFTGLYGTVANSGFPVVRLNADGSYDDTFSSDGIYVYDSNNPNYPAEAYCLLVDNNTGNIYVGGASSQGAEQMMTILGLKPNGTVNFTFGSFGLAQMGFGTYAQLRKLTFQQDGKLLAGGFAYINGSQTALAYARFNSNGSVDNSFGTLGKYGTLLNIPYEVQVVNDINMTWDGRLVALAWLNKYINLGAPNNPATCYVLRYILDITSKVSTPSQVFLSPGLFPNPVAAGEVLSISYSLENETDVFICLFDINGRQLSVLQSSSSKSAGNHIDKVRLPEYLPKGHYFILLSSDKGEKVLKFQMH